MQHNKNTKYIFTVITMLYIQNTEKKHYDKWFSLSKINALRK